MISLTALASFVCVLSGLSNTQQVIIVPPNAVYPCKGNPALPAEAIANQLRVSAFHAAGESLLLFNSQHGKARGMLLEAYQTVYPACPFNQKIAAFYRQLPNLSAQDTTADGEWAFLKHLLKKNRAAMVIWFEPQNSGPKKADDDFLWHLKIHCYNGKTPIPPLDVKLRYTAMLRAMQPGAAARLKRQLATLLASHLGR